MGIVLFPHGGSGNHGCEAIVRSTVKLLSTEITLFSENPEQDVHVGLNELCTVRKSTSSIKRWKLTYMIAYYKYHILQRKTVFDEMIYRSLIKCAEQSQYLFSIGGDNYCYPGMHYYYLVNRMIDKTNVERVLWGASIDAHLVDKEMLEDLKGYSKIIARESLTYDALRSIGLSQTVLYPDPAFVLDCRQSSLPETFIEGNTVGINVSPMVIGYEQKKGQTLRNYVTLVTYLLKETTMNVALIPHVVWSSSDDREALAAILDSLQTIVEPRVIKERICTITDRNCEELKYVISKCRFMVAARTHASIAAYSTLVPTLVVGYSVKATGIARDIFGVEKQYVIPVQSLRKETDLLDAFLWIYRNEDAIREHYNCTMPAYINKAKRLSNVLDVK